MENTNAEKTRAEEIKEKIDERAKEIREKNKEATEAMSEGKGILKLETPIKSGSEEVTELAYDFTQLTGMEYANAMDGDPGAMNAFRITYKQGLTLFATAAAKQTAGLDVRDIQEGLGVTDAVEGVQLATLFFSASTRAGRLRISKR